MKQLQEPYQLFAGFCMSVFCSCCFPGFAQISVSNSSPYNTANYLVQQVLLGQGITASNITSVGLPQQRGFFNGMNSNIGMDSGFVMTSGVITDLVPPNSGNNGSQTQTTIPSNYVSDIVRVSNTAFKMLGTGVTVNDVYDMCVIEFDFIPTGDSLKFRYVFASDEYLQWINTQFNDVFAFMLYGPGINPTDNLNNSTGSLGADGNPDFSSYTINGTAYNPKNIAVVPGSNPGLPITISSIQPAKNSQYYIDNPSQTTVGANGFTTVLTANAIVQCGQKYHFRLMVADASDGILNTWVFLEGGSFTSNASIEISANTILSGSLAGADTALFEDCGLVELTIERQGNLNNPMTFQITTGGTAAEGVDYSFIPDSITFLAGQNTATISFNAYKDALTEGSESIILGFFGSFCSNAAVNSIAFSLKDITPPLTANAADTTINCLINSVDIGVQATGIPPLSYWWSTGAIDTNAVTVSPTSTTTYYVSVTDGCKSDTLVEPVTVNVANEPIALQSSDDTVSCVAPDVLISVQTLSGISPFTYQWSANNATTDTTTVTPSATTDYYVTVTDACGLQSQTDTITVAVLTSEVQLLTNDTGTICPGDSVQLEAEPSGGYPPYTVWWNVGGDSILIATPQSTTTYTAYVVDVCQTFTTATATVTVQQYDPPLAANAGADTTVVCPGNVVSFVPSASGGSGGYSYSWTNWTDTTLALDTNVITSTNFVVAVTDNCPTDTVYDTVAVFVPDYPPVLTVVPDVIHSCPYQNVILAATASGGQGNYTYFWSDSLGNNPTVAVQPYHTTYYSVIATDLCGNSDTAVSQVSIVVPNADFVFDMKEDNTVLFSNNSTYAVSYAWNFGDGDGSAETSPVHNYQFATEYEVILTAESEYGCTDTAVRKLIPPMQIWIPNAFTPNDDAVNDVFQISGIGISQFMLQIFDRWGAIIFQSDNINHSWNGISSKGNLQPMGVYVYRVRAEGLKGETFKKMGSVTLVR